LQENALTAGKYNQLGLIHYRRVLTGFGGTYPKDNVGWALLCSVYSSRALWSCCSAQEQL